MANPLYLSRSLRKSIVLVGMMGAGKSSVGRLLSASLGLPFTDSDTEIERAANMSVLNIFETLGEPAFRDGERKVIARLLSETPMVVATGGGAFTQGPTRALIKEKSISVWLHADLDVLLERTARADTRPLLKRGDPALILEELLAKREPFYAQADIKIVSGRNPLDVTVRRVVEAVDLFLEKNP